MTMAPEEKDLLSQIDAFRQRAELLQSALETKQVQATELDQLVFEKQVKAEELEQIIQEREAQSNVFTRVVREEMDSVIEQFTCELGKFDELIKQQNNDVTCSLAEISSQLERVEASTDRLPETIHKEGVQVYRNTQELIRQLEERVDYINTVDKNVRKSKAPGIVAAVFSILSFLGVAFVILLSMGIIQF